MIKIKLLLFSSIFFISCNNKLPEDIHNDEIKSKIELKEKKLDSLNNNFKSKVNSLKIDSSFGNINSFSKPKLKSLKIKLDEIEKIVNEQYKKSNLICDEIKLELESLKLTKNESEDVIESYKGKLNYLKNILTKDKQENDIFLSSIRELISLLEGCEYEILSKDIIFEDEMCNINYSVSIMKLNHYRMIYKKRLSEKEKINFKVI